MAVKVRRMRRNREGLMLVWGLGIDWGLYVTSSSIMIGERVLEITILSSRNSSSSAIEAERVKGRFT